MKSVMKYTTRQRRRNLGIYLGKQKVVWIFSVEGDKVFQLDPVHGDDNVLCEKMWVKVVGWNYSFVLGCEV